MSYAATYWAKLHPTSYMLHSTELSCTFLSERRCTLSELHCALRARCTLWAMLHPFQLRCALLSYAAPFWGILHPSELRCTLLKYIGPFWSTLHPTDLRLTLTNMMSPATPIAASLFLLVKSIIYSSRVLCLSFVLSYSCRPVIFLSYSCHICGTLSYSLCFSN